MTGEEFIVVMHCGGKFTRGCANISRPVQTPKARRGGIVETNQDGVLADLQVDLIKTATYLCVEEVLGSNL